MIEPGRLRSAMGRFCTGVTVVTTARDDQVHAMTANAFTSVSLHPPLVLVSIDHRTRMHALLPDTRHFGVSVLASDQERVAWHFAGRLTDAGDLVHVGRRRPAGADAIAHVACTLWDEHEAGDHTLYPTARSRSLACSGRVSTLVFRRRHVRPHRGRGRRARRSSWGWCRPTTSTAARSAGSLGEPALAGEDPMSSETVRCSQSTPHASRARGSSRSRRSPTRCPTAARRASRRARSSAPTTCSSASTPTPGWSGTRRRSRGRTPTARRRRRSSRRSAAGSRRACWGCGPARSRRRARAFAGLAGNHCARGAVDVALWDLLGRLAGVPCSTLLGGYADRVAVAHMLSFDTPEAMADDAATIHAEHGVRTFKVKVGRDPQLDVAAVAAIRDALPDAVLYADANRGLDARAGDGGRRRADRRSASWPSRSRSRSRTAAGGRCSPSAGTSRSPATRAACRSPTCAARSTRVRSARSA